MSLLIIYIIANIIASTEGWSGDSHRIVAKLAAGLLSDQAAEFISSHLHGYDTSEEAMVAVADWADSQAESNPYHFSDTPYRACAPFDLDRDCKDGKCLVTGILRYFKEAIDARADPKSRAAAVKYLIHLVADATQPLHTGFREDAGGNRIELGGSMPSKVLHEVWDYSLLDGYREKRPAEKRSWVAIAEYLDESQLDSRRQTEYLLPLSTFADETFASIMVSDTTLSLTCDFAYRDGPENWIKNGDVLSPKYMLAGMTKTILQLMKAAVRLAQVLNVAARKLTDVKRALRDAERKSGSPAVMSVRRPLAAIPRRNNLFEFLSAVATEHDLFADESDSAAVPAPNEVIPATGAVALGKPTRAEINLRDNRALQESAAEMMKRRVGGVDMDSIVVIKRHGKFYLTYRGFITPGWEPVRITQFTVAQVGNPESDSILIWVDLDIFDEGHTLTRETEIALLRKVLGETSEITRDATIERRVDGFIINTVPSELAKYKTFKRNVIQNPMKLSPKEATDREKAHAFVRSKESDLVSIHLGRAWFLSTRDFSSNWDRLDRIRLSLCPFSIPGDANGSGWFLVDARLFDRMIDLPLFQIAVRAKANLSAVVGAGPDNPMGFLSRNTKLTEALYELSEIIRTELPWHPTQGSVISAFEPVYTPESRGVFLMDIVLKQNFVVSHPPWALPPNALKKSDR